jgi:N-acetyl sugar amidotransferase
MAEKKYQICNRCVLDTSDPEIVFDKEGNCNHCTDYITRISKLTYQGEKSDNELKQVVKEIKEAGKKNDYDCVVGVSGGIDSSYVAYLVKNLGLRPLAVHLDNGWNSEEAVNNIKNVCKNLGIDYISHVLDWEEFKDIQLSVLKSSIVEVEIPTDIAILSAVHKAAAKYNIKYIISGGNYATEGLLPEKWFYNPKDKKLLTSIHKKFGKVKMKSFPLFDYKKEMFYKFVKGIKMVYILNYVPFDKEAAMELLKDKLGWKYYGGKHYESKYTGFVQSYYQLEKFNVDYRKATYSTLICTGAMTREEAIESLKSKPYDKEKIKIEIEYLSKKFGLSVEEFMNIMNSPPKSYKDYPNDENKLNFIYGMYKRLKG